MAEIRQRPVGIVLLGLFFCFGTLMSGLAAVSLLWPGTALDAMWRINPRAYAGFETLGVAGPLLLLVVSAFCLAAAIGFIAGRIWGYRLGIGMFVVNLVADVVNAASGREPRAWIGVPIVALLLVYLLRPATRKHFGRID
jgi:hypothetical protein